MTAGSGHRRAAQAMAQVIREWSPTVEISCHDLLDDVPSWLRWLYPATYLFAVRYLATLWGWCFTLLDHPRIYAAIHPLRRWWNLLVAQRCVRELKAHPPDLIITTHFFSADVVSACREAGWLRAPLVVVVTDVLPHRLWLCPNADRFVVAIPEAGQRCIERGVPPERVRVVGIPVSTAFQRSFDRDFVLRQLGIGTARETILVISGGTTVGPFEAVVKELANLETPLPGRLQLLVICGNDPKVVKRLQRFAADPPMPIHVFGVVDWMAEAMAISTLVVAKAGGLILTEALERGLPLIFYHAIPGQERWNALYVVGQGAARFSTHPSEVAQLVRRYLEDPEERATLRRCAGTFARQDVARRILNEVIQPLLSTHRRADER